MALAEEEVALEADSPVLEGTWEGDFGKTSLPSKILVVPSNDLLESPKLSQSWR